MFNNVSEKKIISFESLFYPVLFSLIITGVEFFKGYSTFDIIQYGIKPLEFDGLIGIFTSPLIHSGIPHLVSNIFPFFILTVMLFYFYYEIAIKIFFQIYFMTNLYVWLFARDANHIGASGIVYGLFAFLFISGLVRKNAQLSAVSLLVIFLYGGMIWGVFPDFFPNKNISWESHLMGAVSGLILAIYYRKKGPQDAYYDWEDEDDLEEMLNNMNASDDVKIRHIINKSKQ